MRQQKTWGFRRLQQWARNKRGGWGAVAVANEATRGGRMRDYRETGPWLMPLDGNLLHVHHVALSVVETMESSRQAGCQQACLAMSMAGLVRHFLKKLSSM